MPKFKQRPIEIEAIRLEYRTLIQTPEGAMSAEAGDYLETIRAEEKVHQRIVPGWVFEMSHETIEKKNCKPHFIDITALDSYMLKRVEIISEPHDGYPLTRE